MAFWNDHFHHYCSEAGLDYGGLTKEFLEEVSDPAVRADMKIHSMTKHTHNT